MSLLQQNPRKSSSIMSYIGGDPFYALQTDINKLFGSLLTDSFPQEVSDKKSRWYPRIELKETHKEFIFAVELPGCQKNDVHVSLHNDVLCVKGERKYEENKNDEKYHFSERFYGSFERQIHMPENLVDREKIEAKFEDGVLTVRLGKRHENQSEIRKIDIK